MLKWTIATLFGLALCLTTSVQAQWYVGADFMIPARHTSSNVAFARNQVAGRVGSTAADLRLSEDDLELDLTAGGRITIGNRSGMFGVEGSYFGTTEWTESASFFDPSAGLASPFTPIGGVLNPTFDSNTSILVDYTTRLDTADFNLTQNVYIGHNGSVFLLYGARYLSIEESLSYASDNAVADHSILTTTDNQLFGPQLGVAIEAPLGASLLNLYFKSTLGYNSVDKSTDFDGVVGRGSDQDASFISEIGVDFLLVPTSRVSVHLGWYFLAATDIALATDNFERNPSVLGAGVVNIRTDKKVFYHSPYVGVVFAF